jgi:hypothetical protein
MRDKGARAPFVYASLNKFALRLRLVAAATRATRESADRLSCARLCTWDEIAQGILPILEFAIHRAPVRSGFLKSLAAARFAFSAIVGALRSRPLHRDH